MRDNLAAHCTEEVVDSSKEKIQRGRYQCCVQGRQLERIHCTRTSLGVCNPGPIYPECMKERRGVALFLGSRHLRICL